MPSSDHQSHLRIVIPFHKDAKKLGRTVMNMEAVITLAESSELSLCRDALHGLLPGDLASFPGVGARLRVIRLQRTPYGIDWLRSLLQLYPSSTCPSTHLLPSPPFPLGVPEDTLREAPACTFLFQSLLPREVNLQKGYTLLAEKMYG